MEISETAMWWPQSTLDYLGFVMGMLVVMYLGRQAAHGAIRALCAAFGDLCLRLASAVTNAQERLSQRNREVLLELGREQTERSIEREFHRVNATVARDLSGYPGLNRRIADQIQRIDEDFRASTDVPPTPPAWTQAVAAVANVPSAGDPVVARILGDIHKASDSLGGGLLNEVVISLSRFTLVFREVGEDVVLVLAIGPDGNLGKSRYLMRRYEREIREEL